MPCMHVPRRVPPATTVSERLRPCGTASRRPPSPQRLHHAGDRDTEIAVGCVEKAHVKTPSNPLPNGQVSGYRRSLWAEHTGCCDPAFDQPDALECVRRVNALAQANWSAFARTGGPVPLPHGHLLKYPYTVSAEGVVSPTVQTLPDLGASVMGTRPPDIYIPEISPLVYMLTT